MSTKNKASSQKGFYCSYCDVALPFEGIFQQHLQGKKHKRLESIARQKQAAECKIFVSGLQGLGSIETKENFLAAYFSSYGRIQKITCTHKPFAFVQFDNPQSAQNAIKKATHKYHGCRFAVKAFVWSPPCPQHDVEAEKKEKEEKLQTATGVLSAANDISGQLQLLCEHLRLSEEDYRTRGIVCQDLRKIIDPYFEACGLHQFGSSINGFGMKGCDLDLFLTFDPDPAAAYQKSYFTIPFKIKGELKYKVDVTRAPLSHDQVEAMDELTKVQFLCSMLRCKPYLFKELTVVPSKRCPLVKFVHVPTGLACDLSLNNRKALNNSRLLRLYSQDPRVQQLVIMVRYWARVQSLASADMSSYSLSWLVLHFLMQRKPRVIPCVKDLSSLLEGEGVHEVMVDSCRCLDVPLAAKLPLSENKETAVELLNGFFQFYATEMDWESQAVSTWDAQEMAMKSIQEDPVYEGCKIGCMTLLDPFILSHNTTAGVTDKVKARLESEVKKAAEITKTWASVESGSKTTSEPWGLAVILKPSPVDKSPKKEKDRKFSRIHGEKEDGSFFIDLRPALKLLSDDKFVELSKTRNMNPRQLWCSLAQRMIVTVLESVYFVTLKEEEVKDSCVKVIGVEKKDSVKDDGKSCNVDKRVTDDNGTGKEACCSKDLVEDLPCKMDLVVEGELGHGQSLACVLGEKKDDGEELKLDAEKVAEVRRIESLELDSEQVDNAMADAESEEVKSRKTEATDFDSEIIDMPGDKSIIEENLEYHENEEVEKSTTNFPVLHNPDNTPVKLDGEKMDIPGQESRIEETLKIDKKEEVENPDKPPMGVSKEDPGCTDSSLSENGNFADDKMNVVEDEDHSNDSCKRSAQREEENDNKRFKLQNQLEGGESTMEQEGHGGSSGNYNVSDKIFKGVSDLDLKSGCHDIESKASTSGELASSGKQPGLGGNESQSTMSGSGPTKKDAGVKDTSIIKSQSATSSCDLTKKDTLVKSTPKSQHDAEIASGGEGNVLSFSCTAVSDMWKFRTQEKNSLKKFKGLSLERKVSENVLVKLDKLAASQPAPKGKDKKKGQSNTDIKKISTDTECKKGTSAGTSKNSLVSSKNTSEQSLTEIKRNSSKGDVNKEVGKTETSISRGKDAIMKKMDKLSFTCKIVESPIAGNQHPHLAIVMCLTSKDVGSFRSLYSSFTGVITRLVSFHLLDEEFLSQR